jgi:YggT family protein
MLFRLLYLALVVYAWLIVARALLSWFPLRSGTAVYRFYSFVHDATEPYLSLFRRYLPMPRVGNAAIDLSAIVGLLLLAVLIRILARL